MLNLPFPAAAKTGTTTDWRDNWTIGYSTERIVGTWVGNADNTPMLDVSGVDGAGPIWRDLMLAAHRQEPKPFARPANLVDVAICKPSGLLPSPLCPQIGQETFIRGTEPKLMDDQFVAIEIDLANGLRATELTPAERTSEQIFWILPPEYHTWMDSNGIDRPPPFAQASFVHADQTWVASHPQTGTRLASAEPLVLTAPTANAVFRIAPGLPLENQRIELTGFTNTNQPWHEIRLVKDGDTLSQGQNSTHISAWWTLEAGEHRFWLEGHERDGGQAVRSQEAVIVVEGL